MNFSFDLKSMESGKNFKRISKYIVNGKHSISPQNNQYDRTQVFSAEIPKRSQIQS